MAIVTIPIVDIDGPPAAPGQPLQGGCQINADGDTATLLVTVVRYWNTTPSDKAFTISNAQHTRTVTIPAGTGSPSAPQTITPPFNPGNWTPAIQQNPRTGLWGVAANVAFNG